MNDPSEPIPVQPLAQPVRLEYGTEGPVRLTTVGSYADAFEAHLARTKLEAEGVAAIVDGENVAMAGVYAGGIRKVTVKVAAADVPRAREVLDAIERSRAERRGGALACPECASPRLARSATRASVGWALLAATVILLLIDGWRGWAVGTGVVAAYLFVTPEHARLTCLDCGRRFRASDPPDDEDDDDS